ncbi:MAG: efflux RND transporter periplasmic adaptor subunit [Fimbriimonadaceae bacterium]|nr:efflux RND transporter periplasmic adaptor subunit [Chitinophagales bacterium]
MRFLLIYPIFCSLFILSCRKKQEIPAQKNVSVSVDAMVLQSESFLNTIEVSGNIIANEYVQLKPETAGRITSLNIPEGSMVQKGTLLATLFNDDLHAQLEKINAQVIIAQQSEQRLKTLFDKNGVSRQEYDNALNTVQSLSADINVVKAQIQKTKITAPFTGIVGLRNVSVGAYVSPNDVITTIQETGQLKVDFVIPESYAGAIKKNSEVEVKADASDKIFAATVIAIEPQINTTTRNMKVRAILKEKNLSLQPGAFAKVLINTTDKNNTSFVVPSNAIIPDSRGSTIVLIKNGKAKFQLVETGSRKNTWVQITSGVEKNDTVAINGILYLKPDAAVQIKEMKTPAELGYQN